MHKQSRAEYHPVTFEPMGSKVPASSGESIHEAASRAGIPIRLDCGGKGLCGKCLVLADPASSLSPLSEAEAELLTPRQIASSHRLACQARIRGPLTVTVPEALADSREARGKTEVDGIYPLDPMVRRLVLPRADMPVCPPGTSGDLVSWVMDRARASSGEEIRIKDLAALRELAVPETFKGDLTLVDHGGKGVTAALPGARRKSLGVALDLGTTTLAAYLCDLQTGRVLAAAASVNPQRRFGEDVISRISVANERTSGLEILHDLVVQGVNFLISRCLGEIGASRGDIDEVTAVGNTTMQQLFAAVHPCSLGMTPYLPALGALPDLRAADLGLALNPGTNVHLFPVVSGFVGGDTMGAVLAEGPHHRDSVCLIVDIGTNGEVVLGGREALWATSCATGPALEGAQISCGMRAVSGAIHQVRVEPGTRRFDCRVLGEEGDLAPIGVCGSGIIDAVAAMRRSGLLLPTGRFKEGMPGVLCDEEGIGRRVVLVGPGESGTGSEIAVTLQDIRQIQLAKAALSVGIECLMRRLGVKRIERTVLTGAFGAKFDWRNAVDIGMLPREVLAGEVLPRYNLAGVGAIMALLDRRRREEASEAARHIKFLELAQEPDFNMRFAEATRFPPLEEL